MAAYPICRSCVWWFLLVVGAASVMAWGCAPSAPADPPEEEANAPPTISSLAADPARVAAGGVTSLSVSATDPDGDVLAYEWSAPTGTLSDGAGAAVTWTAPASDGVYLLTVLATDGQGASATGTLAVLVFTEPPADPANSPPTISAMTPASGADVAPSGTTTATVTAADPDGDSLSYTWSATGGAFTGSGASVTWTAPPQPGTYTLTCLVTDGRGGMAQRSVNVTVSATELIVS